MLRSVAYTKKTFSTNFQHLTLFVYAVMRFVRLNYYNTSTRGNMTKLNDVLDV